MEVQINGQTRVLEGDLPVRLTAALEAWGMRADRIAVERNGAIVPRSRWAEAWVENGDKLEVVHFVGGGTGSRSRR